MSAPVRRMLWHRLPVYFPNIKLVMERPDEKTRKRARREGFLEKVRQPSHAPSTCTPGRRIKRRIALRGSSRFAGSCLAAAARWHHSLQQRCSWPHVQATFRTTPEVTKLEVREFLEKVYGAPVVRVDTAIVQGELRKYNAQGKQRSVTVKTSDYKKVFVTFAKGSIQQVEDGIRTRFSPKDAPSTLGMQLGS